MNGPKLLARIVVIIVTLAVLATVVLSFVPTDMSKNIIEGEPKFDDPIVSDDGLYVTFHGSITFNNILKKDIKDLSLYVYMQNGEVVTDIMNFKIDLVSGQSETVEFGGTVPLILIAEHILYASNGESIVYVPISLKISGYYNELPIIGEPLVGTKVDMDILMKTNSLGNASYHFSNDGKTMTASITGLNFAFEDMSLKIGENVKANISHGSGMNLIISSINDTSVTDNISREISENGGKLKIYDNTGKLLTTLDEDQSKAVLDLLKMMEASA